MNTEESKLRAYQVNTDASNSNYAEIKKHIEESANNGRYMFTYSTDLKGDVRRKLNEDGFSIGKTYSERNECATEISWK